MMMNSVVPMPKAPAARASRERGMDGFLVILGVMSSNVALQQDRKSTRLNSSHSQISYAVFCLKKKKKHIRPDRTSTQLNSSPSELLRDVFCLIRNQLHLHRDADYVPRHSHQLALA